jgi:hypothetical protein
MKARTKLLSIVVVFLIATSALSTLPHQAKSATIGFPVGYWEFDEVSGTLANDSSGNGNTGTLVNGPQRVAGISDMALSFDGSDDHVLIQDSSSLDISGNQMSIEFWMKPTVDLPISGASMYIFDKGDAYLGIILGETTGGDASNYGKLEFGFPFSTLNPVDFYSTTNFWASNTWYYIAFTYDGNTMRLYVNGTLESIATNIGSIHSSNYPLLIGSRTSGDREFFKGILDEFAIYNYMRTAKEILDYYNTFTLNSQSPFWMQWYFWTNVPLAIATVGFAFTTFHYRKKTFTSKESKSVLGRSLSREAKTCPNCGANLPSDSKFCGKCGTSLE